MIHIYVNIVLIYVFVVQCTIYMTRYEATAMAKYQELSKRLFNKEAK
jgi:hypothetical protein